MPSSHKKRRFWPFATKRQRRLAEAVGETDPTHFAGHVARPANQAQVEPLWKIKGRLTMVDGKPKFEKTDG